MTCTDYNKLSASQIFGSANCLYFFPLFQRFLFGHIGRSEQSEHRQDCYTTARNFIPGLRPG
jgi:hypothetical protein